MLSLPATVTRGVGPHDVRACSSHRVAHVSEVEHTRTARLCGTAGRWHGVVWHGTHSHTHYPPKPLSPSTSSTLPTHPPSFSLSLLSLSLFLSLSSRVRVCFVLSLSANEEHTDAMNAHTYRIRNSQGTGRRIQLH